MRPQEETDNRLSIALLGWVPPPYGGVSVHVQRLMERLETRGHRVRLIDPQYNHERHVAIAYRRILADSRRCILHAHVAGIRHHVLLGGAAALGKRVVLTVHGQSLEDEFRAAGRIQRAALAVALKRLAAVIAVNARIREFAVQEIGLPAERVFHIPAFLPAPEQTFSRAVDPDVSIFIERYPVVLAANAFNLGLYRGVPLYGADLLVRLLAYSAAEHRGVGVVLFVSTLAAGDAERLAALNASAQALGVSDRLLIVTGSRPFDPVLARSTVMIRPTATDGDSVSIRDALWRGVPVVASDVVIRPPGTVTFRSRDAADLWRATAGILSDLQAAKAALSGLPRTDTFDALLEVYRSVQ